MHAGENMSVDKQKNSFAIENVFLYYTNAFSDSPVPPPNPDCYLSSASRPYPPYISFHHLHSKIRSRRNCLSLGVYGISLPVLINTLWGRTSFIHVLELSRYRLKLFSGEQTSLLDCSGIDLNTSLQQVNGVAISTFFRCL